MEWRCVRRTWLSLLLMACFAAGFPAHAQTGDPITDSRRNAIVTAIERVWPAVVTINVVHIRREQIIDPFFQDFWGLFDLHLRGAPRARERAVESIGSGFLIDAQGHILTNYHVLQHASRISSVSLADGRVLEVELVGYDERTDLALLRAKSEQPLPFIPLGDSADLLVGEWAIAIGNPFGNLMRDRQPSVSVGVISATHRRVSHRTSGGPRLFQDLIQTDAAINPGNSGGPLVNALGQVVGVNTMIFSSSGGNQGLGFAIPSNRVKRVVEEFLSHGRRRQPWLGFQGEAVEALTPYSLQELRVRVESGVLVSEIHTDSPAYHAGLRLGDVITQVNGERVENAVDLDFIHAALFVGDRVRIAINRQGATRELGFDVSELPRTSPR